jgi:hypothetical protein
MAMQQPVAAGDMIHTQAVPRFYMGLVQNDIKSKEAGRPIYDDIEMLEIKFAGNTKTEFHAPASDRCDRPLRNPENNDRYYVRWFEHPDFAPLYEKFKAGQGGHIQGTPLSELPFLTEGRRAELRAINIHSAEQLASLSGAQIGKYGFGMGDLCKQAQNYLERAKGTELDVRHEREKDEMRAELGDLRQKLDMLLSGEAAPKATASAKPAAAARPTSAFDSWEPDDIRSWVKDVIKQNGLSEEDPHPRLGKPKLIEIADRIAAKLQADQSVAA